MNTSTSRSNGVQLQSQILDKLGFAIVNGDLSPGTVLRIEELEEKYGVSRSVIRESLQVLSSMGMLMSRRRVGIQILASSEWNLLDPQVIRWRLESGDREAQLRALTELRIAIEPEAARLAAVRAPYANASDLMSLAGKLWVAGQEGDSELYVELDTQFHGLILTSCGNAMFAMLNSMVTEGIEGRTHYGLMPVHLPDDALQWHIDVASAIQRRDPDAAHHSMLLIMKRTMAEMSYTWESQAHAREND